VPGKRRLAINWTVVEQRRIADGFSHTAFIARVGPCAPTGPRRLWRDDDHDGVRMGLLERLSVVLDLHPAELFTSPSRRLAACMGARAAEADRVAPACFRSRAWSAADYRVKPSPRRALITATRRHRDPAVE
jgi:hypothetical protein